MIYETISCRQMINLCLNPLNSHVSLTLKAITTEIIIFFAFFLKISPFACEDLDYWSSSQFLFPMQLENLYPSSKREQ